MLALCGPTRRCFLRAGSVGSLTLPALLCAAPSHTPRAKRSLLLFLTGGPPQLDTFDPKPDAPAEVRGEFKPIATSVPGVRIGELCPHLARHASLYRIVRVLVIKSGRGRKVYHAARRQEGERHVQGLQGEDEPQDL